jgi:N-formylmaleamate deformylase
MMREDQQDITAQQIAAVKSYRRIEEIIPSHWSEGSVLANGIHHHYYRTGGEKFPLMLLHGFQESGLCWMRVAKVLEQDYDVIMVDTRGHGHSDGIATGFSEELLTEDVAGVIRALKLDKPRLLGHSMGASTAAMVVCIYPDVVRSILLEDPPRDDIPRMEIANSEGYKAWLNSWFAWFEALKTQSHEERLISALRQLPPGSPVWPEDEYVPWVEATAQLNPDLVRLGTSLWSVKSTPMSELIPRISCPVLLMRSTSPFPAFAATQATVQEEASPWPHVKIVRFENTGHLIHREQFDQFIAVVKAFLKEH